MDYQIIYHFPTRSCHEPSRAMHTIVSQKCADVVWHLIHKKLARPCFRSCCIKSGGVLKNVGYWRFGSYDNFPNQESYRLHKGLIQMWRMTTSHDETARRNWWRLIKRLCHPLSNGWGALPGRRSENHTALCGRQWGAHVRGRLISRLLELL